MSPTRDRARAAAMVAAGVITEEASCAHKVRFTSQNDARHAAKSVERKHSRHVSTYKCPFCGGYHVTKLRHGEGDDD